MDDNDQWNGRPARTMSIHLSPITRRWIGRKGNSFFPRLSIASGDIDVVGDLRPFLRCDGVNFLRRNQSKKKCLPSKRHWTWTVFVSVYKVDIHVVVRYNLYRMITIYRIMRSFYGLHKSSVFVTFNQATFWAHARRQASLPLEMWKWSRARSGNWIISETTLSAVGSRRPPSHWKSWNTLAVWCFLCAHTHTHARIDKWLVDEWAQQQSLPNKQAATVANSIDGIVLCHPVWGLIMGFFRSIGRVVWLVKSEHCFIFRTRITIPSGLNHFTFFARFLENVEIKIGSQPRGAHKDDEGSPYG